MTADATNVIAFEPKHREEPALRWEFTLDRENHGLELIVLDDAGHVVATASWPPATTTPDGFDWSAAWDQRCEEPPAAS